MINWFQIGEFLRFSVKAKKNRDQLPAVLADLFVNYLDNDSAYYCFESIEQIRNKLLDNETFIEVNDLGAGSKVFKGNMRKISAIAGNSLKEKKYGQLLFKIVNQYKCKNIIELGTSLGVTTSYLAKTDSKSKVYTFEGCSTIAKIAQANFDELELTNIQLISGNMDITLPEILKTIEVVDFALIDGNHTEKATLNYFDLLLTKVHKGTLFVLDDIYWSKEMKTAWETIKSSPKVVLTIDLFDIGIVLFQGNQKKQNILLKF